MNFLLIPAGIAACLLIGAVVTTVAPAVCEWFGSDLRVVIVLFWLALRVVEEAVEWRRARARRSAKVVAGLPRARAQRREGGS